MDFTTILAILILCTLAVRLYAKKQNERSDNIKLKMEAEKQKVLYNKEIGEIKDINGFETFFKLFNLEKHWTLLKPKIKHELRFKTIPNAHIDIGVSKFGGLPDLPKNINWPKDNNGNYLDFLAQINLHEIYKTHNIPDLPKSGILYFFYVYDQNALMATSTENKFKILYVNNTETISQTTKPNERLSNFTSCSLSSYKSVSLPDTESDIICQLLNKKEQFIYSLITYPEVNHKLLGYSNNIQSEMGLDCELMVKDIVFSTYKTYSKTEQLKIQHNALDWVLLLQIDSDCNTNMMWGDTGRLYFWIKKQDLKKHNFNNCCLILQYY